MAKKTWKIGECCKGGIITVETKGNKVAIIGKDWDFSTGSKKSSNQSNAKEFTRLEFNTVETEKTYRTASEFLNDLTSSFYAEKVLKWIATKVKADSFTY